MVQLGGHLVHRNARKFAARIYRPLVRVQPGKSGQQRRVNVDDAAFELFAELFACLSS